MFAFFRKWFDRAYDIAQDFDYKDFLWCEIFVLTLGILFGVSAQKALKYLTPFIAVFAVFSAFQMLYPHRKKLHDMVTGNYKDRFVEFSGTEEAPDFV